MGLQHDKLAHSLARHLAKNEARMVWEDVPAGPAGSVRPDVFTLNKSYAHPTPISYEIKISVSDFRSDITSGKWQQYLTFSDAVVFAAPAGLITKKDLPNHCGLMVCNEGMWRTVKKPTLNQVQVQDLDASLLLKLLIGGHERLSQPTLPTVRDATDWKLAEMVRKKLGKEIARKVALIDQLESDQERMAKSKQAWSNSLGLSPDIDDWRLHHAISDELRAFKSFQQAGAVEVANELKIAADQLTRQYERITKKHC